MIVLVALAVGLSIEPSAADAAAKPKAARRAATKRRATTTTTMTTTAVSTSTSTVPVAVNPTTTTTSAVPTPTSRPQSFAFARAIVSITVPRGTSVTIPIALSREPGFVAPVLLSASVPVGVTMSFDPNPVGDGAVATLTVLSGDGVLPIITIVGSSGGQVRTMAIAVLVPTPLVAITPAAVVGDGFALGVAQPSVGLVRDGAIGSYLITIARDNNLTGPVAMSVVSVIPEGIVVSFGANPTSGPDISLFVRATGRASIGSLPITVLGTGSAGSVSITVLVRVV